MSSGDDSTTNNNEQSGLKKLGGPINMIKSNNNQLPRKIRRRIYKNETDNITHSKDRTFGSVAKADAEASDAPDVPMWVVWLLLVILVGSSFIGLFGRGTL